MFRRQIDGVWHYYYFGRYYLPEATIDESSNSSYDGWARDHHLIETPGEIIDLAAIESDIKELPTGHEVREVAYDPFQATQLVNGLMADGITCVEVRPTVLNFSEPMKELEAVIRAGRFHYNGDPVFTWMVSNVVCHVDAKDNIYPRKERAEAKIDAVVAAIMCMARFLGEDKEETIDVDALIANPIWI
jgi:phage terminase large subunit-like protein